VEWGEGKEWAADKGKDEAWAEDKAKAGWVVRVKPDRVATASVRSAATKSSIRWASHACRSRVPSAALP
jgi:hypothetical protein